MNTDTTGPQQRECVVCRVQDVAPNLLPYLRRDGTGHAWAHGDCAQRVFESRQENAPIVAHHEHNDGV